jgi:hypothetical protein
MMEIRCMDRNNPKSMGCSSGSSESSMRKNSEISDKFWYSIFLEHLFKKIKSW